MPVRLTKRHPYTITIDNQPVRLWFKRMDVEESEIFKAQFDAYNGDRGKPDEVMASSTEVSAEYRAWLRGNFTWLRDTFAAYITVEPGDLAIDDEPVVTGAALFEVIGSYVGLKTEILSNLYYAQVLTAEQKKTLLSRLASASGSPTAPLSMAAGAPPAPTVDAAASSISVASEPVVSQDDASSGTTVPLSCEPVLSAS